MLPENLRFALVFAAIAAFSGSSLAAGDLPPPVTFTADQDHQNMMDQLGIQALRPGPSGNENAPDHANYDEALANPYPDLPDPLIANDGAKITTAEQWWNKRRPEIVEAFEENIYGRIPADMPKVTWTVTATEKDDVGGIAVIVKRLTGHVDNAATPAIDVNIAMTLVVPAKAKERVPVLMMFGPCAHFRIVRQPSSIER